MHNTNISATMICKNELEGNCICQNQDNALIKNKLNTQINDLISVNYLMSQLTKTDFALDKLNKISEMWNKLNKPEDFRSLILGFVSEDGVKSIDEIENTIKMLDKFSN